MSDIIRIGMVGTGGIARHHIGQITPIPNVKIVALCDTNGEQIRTTLDRFGYLRETPIFEDYHELLAQEDVDAVVVCTPHTQHAQQMLDAIEAGKHILMEKPLVCSVADAHRILERLKTYDKVVGIAYQRHAMGQFIYMHDRIASGELGEVQFISALQCQGWKRGTTGSWRQDPALSGGGQINDSGSHLLDILLWCTGLTVAEVAAYIDNCGTPVDINSALSIRFTNGAQGNISIIGDSVIGWNEDISIWCEKGAFLYRNGNLSFFNDRGVKTTVDGENLPPTHNIDEDFVRAIRGEKEIAAPPICGLRTIELTEAAWRSAAQNGLPVRMN
ncbi:MAG: Gfo/Idh/MocA family oxidoreductase [Capsulimonadales bacterium]|nr:Gfo/Idh/MocA family oxidoreductase [Capsulimonadales bacterium]